MVDESTVVSDTFSEIFDILNSNVQSVTLGGGSSVTLRETDSGNYWLGAFPDIEYEDSSEYPIGVIDSPRFNENIATMGGNTDVLTVEIMVFATRKETAARFAEKAWDQIRSNWSSLQDAGLSQVETLESRTDVSVQGDIKVHEYRIPVRMVFEVAV